MRLASEGHGREELTREPADRFVRQPVHLGEDVSSGDGVGDFLVVGPEPLVFFRQDLLRPVLVRTDVENHLVFLPVVVGTSRLDVAQEITRRFRSVANRVPETLVPILKDLLEVFLGDQFLHPEIQSELLRAMGREVLAEQVVFGFVENVKNLDGVGLCERGEVGNQAAVGLARSEFPIVFCVVAVKLLPPLGFREKRLPPIGNANHRRNDLVCVAESQPADVIQHLRDDGSPGLALLKAAGELEFKEDFRRVQVVPELGVVIQSEMLGVGVFDFLFGLRLEQGFAKTGKGLGHLYRGWLYQATRQRASRNVLGKTSKSVWARMLGGTPNSTHGTGTFSGMALKKRPRSRSVFGTAGLTTIQSLSWATFRVFASRQRHLSTWPSAKLSVPELL